MSQFLKSPDEMFTMGTLYAAAGKYILEELHKYIPKSELCQDPFLENDGVSEIQKMLDASNHKLRMYGSAEELAGNLKLFRNFPEADKFFGLEREPYSSDAVIYSNLDGDKKYVRKSDLFVILQNMALSIFPGSNSGQVVRTILAPLKITQKQNPSKGVEFVEFDQKFFDEIEKEIREAEKVCIGRTDELEMLGKELAAGNFENYAAKFKIINKKKKWNDAESMGKFKSLYNIHKDPIYMALFLLQGVIMKTIPSVIDKRPKMFLPNSGGPITVRLFEDGDEQFVMKAELFGALKMTYKDTNDNFMTMRMEEVQKKYGNRVKGLEFIRTQIHRTQHHAVPIKDPSTHDGFCIPAVDGFLDFAKTLIFGVKIFQKYKVSDMGRVFKEIQKVGFLSEEKNPYFISTKGIEELKYFSIQLINDFYSIGVTKDVRNAKKDGFTLQNLKNELAHLNLLNAFPEIQNHAEGVYSEVVNKKKEEFLRTCDLFNAVEHCQLNCIFERLPEYKKFLHNQKGCHRVYGYKCEECDKNQKTSELQKTPESSKIQKSPETMQKTSVIQKDVQKPATENQKTSVLQKFPEEYEKLLDIQKIPETNQKTSGIQNSSGIQISELQTELCQLRLDHQTHLEASHQKSMELQKKILETSEKIQKTFEDSDV